MGVQNGKRPSVFHRLLSRNRIPAINAGNPPQQQQRIEHSQVNRRTAPPQQFVNYFNPSALHDGTQVQRHSTPIKSIEHHHHRPPPLLHEQPRQLGRVGTRDIVADKNLANRNSATENIYESTDRLQNLRSAAVLTPSQGDDEVVLRNPQAAGVPLNNQSGRISANPQLRSMSRHEIYAHLYAFYQKSKRNSVSSQDTLPRSQSRNSGN